MDRIHADWMDAVSAKVWSTVPSFGSGSLFCDSFNAGAKSQIHFLPLHPYLLTARNRVLVEPLSLTPWCPKGASFIKVKGYS
jgi:hypothetical protein